jgi:hypothetical protein
MGGVWTVDARWRFLVAVVVSVFAFAGTAQATPLFLSAINISDPGADGFEPQVAVDSSGNVHAVFTRSDGTHFRIQYATRTPNGAWSSAITLSDAGQNASQPQVDIDPSGNLLVMWTRFDGTNVRVQAAFKPSGGSFGAPVSVSDPGFDADAPQLDFANNGRAIAVWSRFDGTKLRVQASIREAGPSGSFQNEVTLSEPGQDAFRPQSAAGPNVDANGVIVWTRSDGTNQRVQSARRRDYVGYVRPTSAGAVRVSLTPAYDQCTTSNANRIHGPAFPGALPSCNPPVKTSTTLTVGTPGANQFTANPNSIGSVRWKAILGNTATEANEADVQAIVKITDVRNDNATGTDYTGLLGVRTDLQITDQRNAAEQPEAGTTNTFPLEYALQCVSTASTTIGGECTATTSMNALMPGAALERKRAIWAMPQTTVRDAGPNGTGYASCPPTCGDGDEKVFMRQGLFIP